MGREMRAGKCNGHGHRADCDCGWGGVHYPSDTSIPPAGTTASWGRSEFSARTSCPICRAAVHFVRHNGGSVWFDSLGQPWPKHPCMDRAPDMAWLQENLEQSPRQDTRRVFGIIQDAQVIEPGVTARFGVSCSDGTEIISDTAYLANPCAAVGGLVVLDLTPTNTAVDWQFHKPAGPDGNASTKSRERPVPRRRSAFELRRMVRSITWPGGKIIVAYKLKWGDPHVTFLSGPRWLKAVASEVRVTVNTPADDQRFILTLQPAELLAMLGDDWWAQKGWQDSLLEKLQDRRTQSITASPQQ